MAAGDYTPQTNYGTDYAENVERSLIARLKFYEAQLAATVSPETLVILDPYAECDSRSEQSVDSANFFIEVDVEVYPGGDGMDSGDFTLTIGGKKGGKKSDGRSYHEMLHDLCACARWAFNSPVIEWYDFVTDAADPDQIVAPNSIGVSEMMDLAVRESGGVRKVEYEGRPGKCLEVPYIVRGFRAGAVR